MRYHTILFDLDGTLTDSYEGITRSVQYALSRCGIAVEDRNELRRFIGPSLYDAFTKFYGMEHEQALFAVEKYRERFRGTGIYENKLYPGVKEMLENLSDAGLKLCIASSKPEVFVTRILSHFGIDRYLSVVVGATLDGSLSEKADIIARVLELAGATGKEDILMVGDRYHDAEGAGRNGLDFCGVLYGFGGKEELAAYPNVCLAASAAAIGAFILNG